MSETLYNIIEKAREYANQHDAKRAAVELRIITDQIVTRHLLEIDFLEGGLKDGKGKALKDWKLAKKLRFAQDRKLFSHDLQDQFWIAQSSGNKGAHGDSDELYKVNYAIEGIARYIPEFLKKFPDAEVPPILIKDVTRKFQGKTVSFFFPLNGQYICCHEEMEESPLLCDRPEASGWEMFRVRVDGGGNASFQAHTDKFLSVRIDKNENEPPVMATASVADYWEKFKI